MHAEDRYTLKEQIGRGSFGEVFRGVDNETGEIVAIKVIDLDQVWIVRCSKRLNHARHPSRARRSTEHDRVSLPRLPLRRRMRSTTSYRRSL